MKTAFDRAVERTVRIIGMMRNDVQLQRRLELLDRVIAAQRRGETSLEIPKGESHEGDFLDIVVFNDESTVRDYAVDMRLVILVAALSHPEVLFYINREFPVKLNQENNGAAEATATRILEVPDLIGLWELQQRRGFWILQLVCSPNTEIKPIHGTLLVR